MLPRYVVLVLLLLLRLCRYIAGVTNPVFTSKSEWWDVMCDIAAGTVTVAQHVTSPLFADGTTDVGARAAAESAGKAGGAHLDASSGGGAPSASAPAPVTVSVGSAASGGVGGVGGPHSAAVSPTAAGHGGHGAGAASSSAAAGGAAARIRHLDAGATSAHAWRDQESIFFEKVCVGAWRCPRLCACSATANPARRVWLSCVALHRALVP
jgi:hypothetical protein